MSDLYKVINESFTQYAGAVLQNRVLVDVRDGLKPSARQIFYCLYTDKFLPDKPFKKTLKAIGSCARLYIHGDSSAEGVIMRAGQEFAYRYPLIEIDGNSGSLMNSGNWAASRYTSSRLTSNTVRLFKDIEKNTIEEWRNNYDDTEQYPAVLPSKGFYNIVNGSLGIGIGAAASVPQYNIKELNEALIYLLWHPDCSFEEIYCAPDFATGATLLNENEVKESMRNGKGFACKLRATIDFDSKDRILVVTEIPYGVYTNTICKELETIINDEENNPGIEKFNDLTGTHPLIKIYLSKKANVDRVIRYLYANTSLQSYYGINFTMLKDGRFPKVFTWKEMLQEHLDHEKVVYRRGFEYDIKKWNARIHILKGLLIAINDIDNVVKIIKRANSSKIAGEELKIRYSLDDVQVKAILDMKLSRLAHLEVNKITEEIGDLEIKVARIMQILESEELLNKEIEKGLRDTIEKFGDARRTKVMNIEKEEDEPIERKILQLSLTNKNNIYLYETSSLYTQKRGGVGNKIKLDKDEFVRSTIKIENIDNLLFFSDLGYYYNYSASAIPLEEKIPIESLFMIEDNEKFCCVAAFDKNNRDKNILFFTEQGYIKKSLFEEYNTTRKTRVKALNLMPEDKIVKVLIMNDEKIGILASDGNFIITETKNINPIGRIARGIKGIKLNPNQKVVTARAITDDANEIISITKNGLAKRSLIKEFSVQGLNTKGVKLQNIQDDGIIDFDFISNETEILIATNNSCIKLNVNDIPLQSRATYGTKTIKLKSNAKVIGLTKF